jgi:hypothetical protein
LPSWIRITGLKKFYLRSSILDLWSPSCETTQAAFREEVWTTAR